MKNLWLLIGLLPLLAHADGTRLALTERWYTDGEVEQGREVFQGHCAACHGERGQGAREWSDRSPLPPPLDGSGHVAHHSLDQLLAKIEQGGRVGNGRMPAIGAILTVQERRAALAWLQSLWPDSVYRDWQSGPGAGGHRHQ